MKIKAKLDMPSIEEMLKATGLEERGRVQKYIDTFVLYHSEPYEPGKHIHNSGVQATDIGSGKVIWDDPSSQYLYEGKLMVDPFNYKGAFYAKDYGFWSRPRTQKIMDPSGRSLNFKGGAKRGDHWFDRMIENEMDDLMDGVQNIIDGGK